MAFKAEVQEIPLRASVISTKDIANIKDPEEEFFRLTTLAVKALHQNKEKKYVSAKSLYRQAKDEDLPFHLFHGWIEKQILVKAKEDEQGLLGKVRGLFSY